MKNCFKNLLYMVKKIFLSVLLVLPLTAGAQSLYPGQFAGCRAVPDKVRTAVECFDLGEVRLLPGRFMDNMLRDSAWMASVDAGRLLHSFRTNAGVFSGKEGGYMTVEKLGGWESLDCDLRGHTWNSRDGDIAKTLEGVPGQPLTFVTEDGLVLKPLYDTHHDRYVVYWDL